jgi:hypothetical protein
MALQPELPPKMKFLDKTLTSYPRKGAASQLITTRMSIGLNRLHAKLWGSREIGQENAMNFVYFQMIMKKGAGVLDTVCVCQLFLTKGVQRVQFFTVPVHSRPAAEVRALAEVVSIHWQFPILHCE